MLAPADDEPEVPGLEGRTPRPAGPFGGTSGQRVGGPGRDRSRRSAPGGTGRAPGRVRRLAPARAAGARTQLRLSGGVRAAQGRDVPPSRKSIAYTAARPCGPRLGATPGRALRGVARGARHRPGRAGRDLRHHRQRHRPRPLHRRRGRHDDGADRLVRGTPRGAQGTRGPPRGGGRLDLPPTSPSGWRERAPTREGLRRRHPPSDRIVWLGRVDDVELAARLPAPTRCARPRSEASPSGWCCSRPWRRAPRWWRATFPGTRPWWGATGSWCRPATWPRGQRPSRPWPVMPRTGTGLCAPDALEAAFRHASQWSMPAVAERYVAVYERVVAQSRRAG